MFCREEARLSLNCESHIYRLSPGENIRCDGQQRDVYLCHLLAPEEEKKTDSCGLNCPLLVQRATCYNLGKQ